MQILQGLYPPRTASSLFSKIAVQFLQSKYRDAGLFVDLIGSARLYDVESYKIARDVDIVEPDDLSDSTGSFGYRLFLQKGFFRKPKDVHVIVKAKRNFS